MSSLTRLGSSTCSVLQQYSNYAGCVNLMFVRFRKPRWRPKAASKIFKVREPTVVDPEEEEVMKEWVTHYNTAKKSIMKFLRKHDQMLRKRALSRQIQSTLPMEVVFNRMERLNDSWNLATAQIREAEMAKQFEVDVIRKQKVAERDEREKEEIKEKAKQKVLAAQEWKETYITDEKMDDYLEEVLNTRTDYEFALNLDGTCKTKADEAEKQAEQEAEQSETSENSESSKNSET